MQTEEISTVEQLEHLLDEADGRMTTLANASAFLNELLRDINWVGFYLLEQGALRLGPFQGKVACTRIAIGNGVCGTAIQRNQTQLVEDVHAFPDHIACDSATTASWSSYSKMTRATPLGVLDIDSPLIGRFTEDDARQMEQAAEIISRKIRQT
ncbi:MAG: GAF domain-containing protein [Eubacteriales bacterium]